MVKHTFSSIIGLAIALSILQVLGVDGSELGSLTCTNGVWIPDIKLLGFGLTCPLPLDNKAKSKGKTCMCALKKIGAYDGTTMKTDKIAPELCAVYKQEDIAKQCKQTVQNCLKNSKGYFKDSKSDPDYKTWSGAYECVEKWVQGACKKPT